jgi:hypothetical protein|tara:strand:+ start:310 stop:597 length:288 start_codon:yes stop_codon:yes gene_type:complete
MTKSKQFIQTIADTLREMHLYKEKQGCFDCRNHYPHYVLEFDHKPEFNKIDVVYRVLRNQGPEAGWQEVAKCDVVCANCHKIRTYQREHEKYENL